MNAKNALMIGIAGMGVGAIMTGLGALAAINYQQTAISGLERRVESAEDFAFRQEVNAGFAEYIIFGDEVNADALNALLSDYENRISKEFDSLTARTGIERKALTAAGMHDSKGPVTGASVKGPVNLFFRNWEELGGAGKSPVTLPELEQVASAAYGGKPYMADYGINIASGVSKFPGSVTKPSIFDLGTTYIALQK